MEKSIPTGSKLSRATIEAAQNHLFLCVGPDCCDPSEHQALWDLLKSETRSLPVLRSKAACLRICTDGPWLVVYPEGIWYGRLTADRLRRILRDHIVGGQPVTEWIATTMPCLGKAGHLPLTPPDIPS